MPTHLAWLLAITCSASLYWKADCFHCFKCNDLAYDEDCSNVTKCAANERCFVERHGHGNTTRFNLGCIDSQRCQSHKEFTIVGRSTKDRSTHDRCLECCARDGCNKELCEIKDIPVAHTQSGCDDDPFTNCSRMSKLVNICSDIHQAKQVCRNFCGLCALVDGGWTPWSNWTSCTTSCGVGYKSRSRSCTNPAPRHGGDICPGNGTQVHSCFDRDCPVHGAWNNWGTWEGCSVPCGTGVKKRHRECNNPIPSLYGRYCLGDAIDFDICTGHACGNTTVKDNSTKTSDCHDVLNDCDVANRTTGICSLQQYSRQMCAEFCGFCSVVDGQWADWSSWGTCSTTCGNGTSSRSRSCTNPSPAKGGKPCTGSTVDTGRCNLRQCPVHGHWSPWGKWTTCSASCGQGLTHRRRTCTHPRPSFNGNYCFNDPTEYAMCTVKKCPVDGGWSEWSLWSSCSVSCGSGQMARKRSCSNPSSANGGHNCTGKNLDHKSCHAGVCSESSVVFHVSRPATSTPSSSRIVIFTNVLSNAGNGYNATTGIFTVPKAGAYLFSLQECVPPNEYGTLHMVVDSTSNVILSVYTSNVKSHTMVSSSGSILLRKGQRIWIYHIYGTLYDDQNCGTKWSGVLVDT